MKTLDAIRSSVLPFAGGVPIPTADYWILQSAIELCERTKVWKWEDTLDVVGEEEEIYVPYGANVVSIQEARFNGVQLEPKTNEWLDDHVANWREAAVEVTGQYITQLTPNTLRVVPAASGELTLTLHLKPAYDADELPDFLVNLYRREIAHGALGYILALPNQPFTDMNMAVARTNLFQEQLDKISADGEIGQQLAPLRTKPAFF